MTDTLPSLPERRVLLWIIAGFLVLGFLIYGLSLRNDFVRWDDSSLITENVAIRMISPASLHVIFSNYDPELYIPLTFFSYQLDFLVGGANPFVYHLHSLLLHIANALLVAWLFFLLTRGRKGLALLAGLLFLAHPLHTEAVAWAAARKDVLSALFFFASLIAYVYYRDGGGKRVYRWSVAFFLLGLMAKVVVVTLPVVLLLLDLRERRRWSKQMLVEKAPYFVLAVLFGVIALFGKREALAATPFLTKALLAVKSAAFSMGLFFWPHGLSTLYPFDGAVILSSPAFFVPALFLIALVLFSVWTLRWTRDIAFGVFFFLMTISPTFTNLAKGSGMFLGSDRYVYIPSIGLLWLLLLFGSALWVVVTGGASPRTRNAAGIAVSAAVVFLLGAGAFLQSLVWKDTESLFRHALRFYPSSYVARNNLANALRREGRLDEAAEELRAALAVHPDAGTWSYLGAVYRKQGKRGEALGAYEQALKTGSGTAEPYMGLGLLYAEENDFSKALEAYSKAIQLRPSYAEAYTNRGSLLLDGGRTEEAAADLREAVRSAPLLTEARFNLALALQRLGKRDEAMAQYRTLVQLQPSYVPARLNLGVLYYQEGDAARARAEFEAALRAEPGNATAREALRLLGGR